MKMRNFASYLVLAALLAGPAFALQSGEDLWIPAAARGAGSAGSFWVTDLFVSNLDDEAVTLNLTWLERDRNNSDALVVPLHIEGGESVHLEDVIFELFGMDSAAGAIRISVAEENDKTTNAGASDGIVATAQIFNEAGDGTFGQGFEALLRQAAIAADGKAVTTVIGIVDNDSHRANWFGLNITEDRDGDPEEAEVMVEVLDPFGEVVVSQTLTLAPFEAVLHPVSQLGAGDLDLAALRFTMLEGTGLFGASKVDLLTNDPVTLEAEWSCASCDVVPGSGETIAEAKLYIEFNHTDDDIGVHGAFDDHGYSQLCVFDPNGEQILSLKPQNQLKDLTMAGIFFESREPPGDEFSFEDLTDDFAEGQYSVLGVTYEGKRLSGQATFTHDVPAPPVILNPELVEDEEDVDEAAVPREGLVVEWEFVTTTFDGDPLAITGYEVIITDEESEDPHGFSRPIFDVHVPPDRNSLSVPVEFLLEDTVYELEILALEGSGNQTITVGFFKTD